MRTKSEPNAVNVRSSGAATPETGYPMQTLPENPLPVNTTRTRMQTLLNEGDERFFADHPGEQHRIGFHFRGEHMDERGEPTRYIVVSRDDANRLVRRFRADGGEA